MIKAHLINSQILNTHYTGVYIMLKNRDTENKIMDYLTDVLGYQSCELFEEFLRYFSCDDTVDFLVNFCKDRDIEIDDILNNDEDDTEDDEE